MFRFRLENSFFTFINNFSDFIVMNPHKINVDPHPCFFRSPIPIKQKKKHFDSQLESVDLLMISLARFKIK